MQVAKEIVFGKTLAYIKLMTSKKDRDTYNVVIVFWIYQNIRERFQYIY